MPHDFVLPDLGEGITEGEVRKWLVKKGDAVEEHQTVLEIETDKAVVEVPSPKKGVVLKINKEEGDIAKVGEVLMTIAEEGEMTGAPPEAPRKKRRESVSVVGVVPEEEEEEEGEEVEGARRGKESVSVVGSVPEEEEEEVLATPSARQYAKELGVRIVEVKGTGPAGSVTMDDVRKSAEKAGKPASPHGEEERKPLRGLRRTISRNLTVSQKTTAFVTGMDEVDITELWELRERERKSLADKKVHLTFLPFFIKAVIHSLAEHPYLNASIDQEREEIILKKYYHIGIAVDTPDGLMVPVIKECDKKTIIELADELQELSVKARERKIKLEEMRGGTFTITNYGHFGGTFATPIINYPESAILGTGKISEKPWVKDGQIVIRKILPISLTFDHRVTDGVDASKFLTKVSNYLEDPALLFIESA
jgi:pyruvate dehydrogenase E2 component (dihydrolipoyllysine-residue acetyltransferase)